MMHQVLARKHRPRDFDGLVGQEHVVTALRNALTQGRLHHAYLFTGTRGVGKTTVSRVLAKSLNCTGPDGRGGVTDRPCGVCQACRDIDAGRFVDYVELDAASNRGVEEMAQLLDQSVYKPVLGRFKVYMIDEVHMLTTHAFNAMLKTLEEPPDYVKFVLATTDPQKVPPTVLSRCLQFNLRPLPAATVREESVRAMLGAVDHGHAVRLVQALGRSDGAALVSAVDALRAAGLSAQGTLDEVALLAQHMAVAQVAPEALPGDDPESSAARALAGVLPADETQLLYSLALQGRQELPLAPDEYSGLLMVLLRALAFRADAGAARPVSEAASASAALRVTPAAAVASAPAVRPGPSGQPPTARPAAASPSAEPDRTTMPVPVASRESSAIVVPSAGAGALDDWWDETVRALLDRGAVQALARELALQSQCVGHQTDNVGRRVLLRVERESLRVPGQIERLRAALADHLGGDVALETEAGALSDSPALREARRAELRQREAEDLIHNDPVVRSVMAEFKSARIVPGSIKPLPN